MPYYVTGKDMDKNTVYVTTNLDDQKLWHNSLTLADLHWINGPPNAADTLLHVRTRYRAPLVGCTLQVASLETKTSSNTLQVALSEEIRAITPGQSAVIYDGDRVVGGGIVI